jgi:hypothetical protein
MVEQLDTCRAAKKLWSILKTLYDCPWQIVYAIQVLHVLRRRPSDGDPVTMNIPPVRSQRWSLHGMNMSTLVSCDGLPHAFKVGGARARVFHLPRSKGETCRALCWEMLTPRPYLALRPSVYSALYGLVGDRKVYDRCVTCGNGSGLEKASHKQIGVMIFDDDAVSHVNHERG